MAVTCMNGAAYSPIYTSINNAQQYQAVLRYGKVVTRGGHFLLHALRYGVIHVEETPEKYGVLGKKTPFFSQVNAPQLYTGSILPKRWARRAVTRNLIKRQFRSLVAEHYAHIPKHLVIVVRLHASFDGQFISASSSCLRKIVRTELQSLLKIDWSNVDIPLYQPNKIHKTPQQSCQPDQIAIHSGTMPNLL